MNGEGAIEIVRATPQAGFVEPMTDIEPAEGIQSIIFQGLRIPVIIQHLTVIFWDHDYELLRLVDLEYIPQMLLVRFKFWRRAAVVSYWY